MICVLFSLLPSQGQHTWNPSILSLTYKVIECLLHLHTGTILISLWLLKGSSTLIPLPMPFGPSAFRRRIVTSLLSWLCHVFHHQLVWKMKVCHEGMWMMPLAPPRQIDNLNCRDFELGSLCEIKTKSIF